MSKETTSLLALVIGRLGGVKGPDGRGWHTALCPFHDDRRKPNLSFRERGFRCFACGEGGGLKKLAAKLGIETNEGKRMTRRIAATYDYRDESRNLLFQAVRYDPKGFSQRRPDGKRGWIWDLNGVRRIVYRLPELLGSPVEQWVFVTEGEKAADLLVTLGLAATCSPMGAGSWREEYDAPFSGRRVAVLQDNDESGMSHTHEVAISLCRVAKSVKVIAFPDLGLGEDVYDWLSQGHTAEDLLCLAEESPLWGPEDGAGLLDAMTAFIRRFVVLSQPQANAIALWVLHTHAFDAAEATPYLSITSAEKRSGKTRLLEALELVVARPWFTGRVTAAVLARKVHAECPTLLLDESDAAFKGEREYAEALRGMLNSGHRRGGRVSLCIGKGVKIDFTDFSTFCPKAVAGIGKLPDTVSDRSIPVRLKRRAPGEQVARFRRRKAQAEAVSLWEKVARWSAARGLADAEPDIPDALDDRSADCWEPLLAIADAAGGDWPRRAREAAVELMVGDGRLDDSLGVRLLADIRTVFADSHSYQISSADLVEELLAIEESPWSDLRGHPLDARRLAALLKPYDIRPKGIRTGAGTPKGYREEHFQDAFLRYLPPLSHPSATPQHSGSSQPRDQVLTDPQHITIGAPRVADDSGSYRRRDVADVADGIVPEHGESEVTCSPDAPGDEVEGGARRQETPFAPGADEDSGEV